MKMIQRLLAWGIACAAALACAAGAQQPDPKQQDPWAKVNLVHYEVVGEVRLKQHPIPAEGADLHADVTERVRISFDWDRKRGAMVGPPKITNEPATVDNLSGADKDNGISGSHRDKGDRGDAGKKRCPVGKMNGPLSTLT
jgi:hypothetical protein